MQFYQSCRKFFDETLIILRLSSEVWEKHFRTNVCPKKIQKTRRMQFWLAFRKFFYQKSCVFPINVKKYLNFWNFCFKKKSVKDLFGRVKRSFGNFTGLFWQNKITTYLKTFVFFDKKFLPKRSLSTIVKHFWPACWKLFGKKVDNFSFKVRKTKIQFFLKNHFTEKNSLCTRKEVFSTMPKVFWRKADNISLKFQKRKKTSEQMFWPKWSYRHVESSFGQPLEKKFTRKPVFFQSMSKKCLKI